MFEKLQKTLKESMTERLRNKHRSYWAKKVDSDLLARYSQLEGGSALNQLESAVLKLTGAIVSADKAEVEDESQYGMNDEVFKEVINESNQKPLYDDSNRELRRLFYSSLFYNKEKIKDFVEILKKIESDIKNKGTWIIDIMNAVIGPLQFNFEKVINKLEENQGNLEKLSLDDLREIKSKLEEIQLQRLTWRKSVDAIIAAYKAKKESIDSDSEKLINHISEGYKNLITVKIPGMKGVSDKILSLIDKIR
ncbi:Antigen P35 [Borrelia coriaceae ATCC 43381]|uniref:Antigen P35 n=1 Tax=Borrelia coriaceae ATCC 43381 TaxID=1408429 RepID=W5T1B8_9SPIR|nr:Antigen P35 [Borrelia coriaceae ATCC 43381]